MSWEPAQIDMPMDWDMDLDMDWDMNFDGLDEMSWGPAHDRYVYDADNWLEFGCPEDFWEAYGLTACWMRRVWDAEG